MLSLGALVRRVLLPPHLMSNYALSECIERDTIRDRGEGVMESVVTVTWLGGGSDEQQSPIPFQSSVVRAAKLNSKAKSSTLHNLLKKSAFTPVVGELI